MACSSCRQPSFAQKLVNVSGAIKRTVTAMVNGERVFSLAEMKHKRITICKACKLYDKGWCSACGCFCSAKASLQQEACPEGKW